MNPIMTVPIVPQLQLHQQMFFRQQQIALRSRRPEDIPNPNGGWPIPYPGRSPPLPHEVKVELQKQELWQRFYAETTEMIITKLGRRMYPSIELAISGLERRAHYRVLLEVAPASDRRHKYVGDGNGIDEVGARGWTSAGPADPQPRIERRIYQHPDSPATGAHWMQHPVSFNKLKLTNNTVDDRNNVVVKSMHKYVPRIWIIRCEDSTRINDLCSQPSSSFTLKLAKFIAVTAYQNKNITKLKIDNNPFAKGHRKTGKSRCKRKFQQTEDEESDLVDIEDCNVSSSESVRTASSETGSLDDSGVSSCGGVSPPLPPIAHQNLPSKAEDRQEAQPRLHRPWEDSLESFAQYTSLLPSSLRIHDLSMSAHYLIVPPFHRDAIRFQ